VRPAPRRLLIGAALFTVTDGVSTPLAAYGVFLPVFAETFAWSRGAVSAAVSMSVDYHRGRARPRALRTSAARRPAESCTCQAAEAGLKPAEPANRQSPYR